MKKRIILVIAVLAIVLAPACSAVQNLPEAGSTEPSNAAEEIPGGSAQTPIDPTYTEQEGVGVIYLAGGCFWGMEKLMQSIPGVVSATSGYANGQADILPTYDSVSTGLTGYRETVRVAYEMDEVSLEAILFAFFHVIDPTVENAQGNDRGTQYQTGIYYPDKESGAIVEQIADIERERNEIFVVEIGPLESFYDAEEYHQDYLDKNPAGYCHIGQDEFEMASNMIVDPADYPRPAAEDIQSMLTEEQFIVTQQAGTEAPFDNEYWDNKERGIYVDIVTGEPLYSSSDKYDSGTGWPSFSKPIDINNMVFLEDSSFGMRRVEVRSRTGNSHLGHVFGNDPVSPSGTRYCINSAALRFVPYAEMEAEGYGYLTAYVD